MSEEQEARIALLEHFRSATQHWATVLVALAITFFSVLQFKSEIEKLFTFWLSPLGGADFLAALVVTQGIYGTYRMVVNGMLGELVVDPETTLSDQDKGSTCFVRLYNAVVNRIFKGKGHGVWFCLNRWGGWVACTVLFAASWIILLHLMHWYGQ